VRTKFEVKKDFYWVGAVDWNVRDFHGYSTYKGTTYNSFLAVDDKITLFDTVKKGFQGDLLHNLYKVIGDPAKVDYLVVNHVEPDHSGSLPAMMERLKPEKLICSPRGKKAIIDHYHREDWPFEVVKTGDEISIGKRTIQFIETRMVHWPDSMFSYLKEDAVLIASDGFGQHWATSERFNDEVSQSQLMDHAAKYYANILTCYSVLIQKLLASVLEMGLKIDMICPDHGLIWRDNPMQIVEAYDRWSRQVAVKKAVIIYDTMWHSTESMAKAVADGLVEEGVPVKLMDLTVNHRSDIMTEVLDAKAIVVGSPTLNNGMLPRMADLLHYLRGLRPMYKLGAAFGSYGWSGEAVKLMNAELEAMKVNIVHPGVRMQYVPDHPGLRECVDLGRELGKAVNKEL
jgi:flavorubredoxin